MRYVVSLNNFTSTQIKMLKILLVRECIKVLFEGRICLVRVKPQENQDFGIHLCPSYLISTVNAHSESINGLAVAPDHSFFVSCSDDKTVKVWDTARLERNVTSKPRHTYTQHHSRVKCICILEGFHCFASAADDGALHIVRVHVTQTTSLPKYGKLQLVREYKLDTPGEYITTMTHYNLGKPLFS